MLRLRKRAQEPYDRITVGAFEAIYPPIRAVK